MLNNIGPMGFILIAIVVLVLFGRGKISSMMGEVGKGITSFKRGMDEGKREIEDANVVVTQDVTPATTVSTATSAGVPPISVTPVVTAATHASQAVPERRDAL